jgi:hypothetical protein
MSFKELIGCKVVRNNLKTAKNCLCYCYSPSFFIAWEKLMYLLKIKHFDYFVALGIYFIISFLVLDSILTSPGSIGFFHDWSIGPYYEINEYWANKGLYIWDSQIRQ